MSEHVISARDVAENLADVRSSIARSEADYGRKPGSVTLVAVSKTKSAEEIAPALDYGQRISAKTAFRRRARNGPACAHVLLASNFT